MLMQIATAVAAAKAVYDSEDKFRDEKCSCAHEDHTLGNGCESRWCVCRWWHKED